MDILPPLNVIDIVALAFIAVCALHGLYRKLSGEIAHVLAALAAFILGIFLYRPFGNWRLGNTRLDERGAHAVAFLLTVLVAIVCMVALRFVVKRAMTVVFEPATDRIGGLFAGALRGAVIMAIVFVVMNVWPHDYLNRKFGHESLVGTLVLRLLPEARERMQTQVDKLRGEKDPGEQPPDETPTDDFNRPKWLR